MSWKFKYAGGTYFDDKIVFYLFMGVLQTISSFQQKQYYFYWLSKYDETLYHGTYLYCVKYTLQIVFGILKILLHLVIRILYNSGRMSYIL